MVADRFAVVFLDTASAAINAQAARVLDNYVVVEDFAPDKMQRRYHALIRET